MSEHLERSDFEPRLPDDPVYWADLADRITQAAEPVFTDLDRRPVWWKPLDRLAPALGIGALAAAAATLAVLPPLPAEPATPVVAAGSPPELTTNPFLAEPAPDMTTLLISCCGGQP